MSRRKPGEPIPGTEQTVSASKIAAALGLRPGSAPKEGKPPALTPAQARKQMSNEYVGEPPDIGWETITVPGGRDVAEALGVDLAKLPVGVEAELGPPQPRPERRPDSTPTPSPEPSRDEKVEELRAATAEHLRRQKVRTEEAIRTGTPEQKRKAAEEAEESVSLVKKIHEKITQ